MLVRNNINFVRGETSVLQINVGTLCNLSCQHCHLDAGPQSKKIMKPETIAQIINYAKKNCFAVIDITGGAPELNPHIVDLIAGLSPATTRLTLRTNLTALKDKKWDFFIDLCKEHRVVIIASFPSLDAAQTDVQRGKEIFQESITSLKKLNSAGYGVAGCGLELDLVTNPSGDYLPAEQAQIECLFHKTLLQQWGITFDHLYSLVNSPLGRFRNWLAQTSSLDAYMQKLYDEFNPDAISSLMCRSLISLDWEGYLYDCDFNLAAESYLSGRKIHITEIDGIPAAGIPITVSDHCYACTVGAGFT